MFALPKILSFYVISSVCANPQVANSRHGSTGRVKTMDLELWIKVTLRNLIALG